MENEVVSSVYFKNPHLIYTDNMDANEAEIYDTVFIIFIAFKIKIIQIHSPKR